MMMIITMIMTLIMMIMMIIIIYLLYQALSLSGSLQSTIVRRDQKDPSLHWNSYKSIEGG
jgi:ABC-type maltose transport system permease subunit